MAATRGAKQQSSGSGTASKVQRDWIVKLGDLAGAAAGGGDQENGEEKQSGRKLTDEQRKAVEASVKKGILPSIPGIPGGEIPEKIIDKLFGERSALVRIRNNTGQTMLLDPLSLREVGDEKQIGISHGKYNSLPPDSIESGGEFSASSNTIAGLTTTGAEARIRYFLDDQKTAWIIHFDNSPLQAAKADVFLDGPNKAQFKSPSPVINDAKASVFAFTLNGGSRGKGGGGTGTEVSSNCIITINNKTDQELTLVDQGHDRGDFMTFPPTVLPAGGSGQFVSVETPNSKDQGCKGFVEWEVGSAEVICRMEWDNPEQKKNTTKATVNPSSSAFKVLDQIGQGEENVPVAFTISGKGGGGNGGTKEEKFEPPPVEAKQPTLRKGDQSKDGWVEYLQLALNFHVKADLEQNGTFDQKTHIAVIKFQKKNKLLVDGVVGNQTWAALREGAPEKPSTDGRKPHTHVEEGAEARWDLESSTNNFYSESDDEFGLGVISLGDKPIDKFQATIRITPPNTKPTTIKLPIGPVVEASKTGQGNEHSVIIRKFRKKFPSSDPAAKITDYVVEAYLPPELGGDFYKANIREA